MEASLAELQTEVERQRLFIKLLVEKNQALESQLAFAHQRLEAQSLKVSVAFREQNAPEIGISGTIRLPDGTESTVSGKNTWQNIPESTLSGTTTFPNSTQQADSVPSGQQAVPEPVMADSPGGFESLPFTSRSASIRLWSPQNPEDRVALAQLARDTDYKQLCALLNQAWPKVRYMRICSLARLLLHLLTHPRNSYVDLMGPLSFSKGGVGKLLTIAQRLGLIETVGYQQYALTQLALGYVWEAMELRAVKKADSLKG